MSERIPSLDDNSDYCRWKKAVAVWQLGTTAKKEQQAARLIGFMEGRAYEAALQIKPEILGAADGVNKLTEELDKLFLKDATHNLFIAIEEFEHYQRPEGVAMDVYVRDFEQKRKKIDQLRGKEVYEDGVLAYKLLNQANLNPDQRRLVKATISKLEYKEMVKSLKQTFGDEVPSASPDRIQTVVKQEPEMDVLFTEGKRRAVSRQSSSASAVSTSSAASRENSEEEENVLYNTGRYRGRGGGRGKGKYRKSGNERQNKQGYGQGCFICHNPQHRVADCPYNTYKKENQDQKKNRFTYLANMKSEFILPERDEEYTYFIGETVNKGLLDTGASATVCGRKWLDVFKDSLTEEEERKLKTETSKASFRFGDGESVRAKELVTLPVKMFGRNIVIRTHVVETDIPLLLSKQTMKEHKFVIDVEKKRVLAYGGEEPILDTASGHMVVSIGREDSRDVKPQEMTYFVDVNDAKKTAYHLHRYFAHGSAKKIGEWVKTSDVENSKEIIRELELCEAQCDFCLKHKTREAPRRKVAIPSGNVFNEVIAMDLKKLSCGVWIIHMIDTVTRFTVAASLCTKTGREIVSKIFKHWISVFGRPGTIITDNGGEFINRDFLDMCSMCSINFKTSPASSPWCNGMVERHHSMLSNMINGVLDEQKCNLDVAIGWSCNAKNSLNNVFGFTPYQLVFGKTPTVPCVLNYENLPSLSNKTASIIVAENLNALEEARRQFTKLENSEKLKKVLRERVYTRNNAVYSSGDKVYYKRDDEFQGPGYVVGQQDNCVLIKHGGALVRVNPSKVVLKTTADDQVNKSRTGDKDPSDVDTDKDTSKELKTCSIKAGGMAADKDTEDVLKAHSSRAGGMAVDKDPRTETKTHGGHGSGRLSTKEEQTKTHSSRASGMRLDKDPGVERKTRGGLGSGRMSTDEDLTKTRSMRADGNVDDKGPRTKAKTRSGNGSGRIGDVQESSDDVEVLTKTHSMRAGGISDDKRPRTKAKTCGGHRSGWNQRLLRNGYQSSEDDDELTKTRSMQAGGINVDKRPRIEIKTRTADGSGRVVGLRKGVEQRHVTSGISRLYGELILSDDCEEYESAEESAVRSYEEDQNDDKDPVEDDCEEYESAEESVVSNCEVLGGAEEPVEPIVVKCEELEETGEPVQVLVQNDIENSTVESHTRMESWTRVEPDSRTGALSLKKNQIVRFRCDDSEEWTKGLVASRAGKASGKHKNEFNMEMDNEEDTQAVNLEGMRVERLMFLEKEKNREEELLFIEEDSFVYCVNKMFIESPDVKQAKEQELLKFREFGVYEEVRDVGQPTVSSRWIVTQKENKSRARLVARGYEEDYPRSDAPTSNKTSLRLLFSIAAGAGWELQSLDISAAFLQSEEIKREVYMKPPGDIRKQGVIWKLKKPVYGLGDSARNWYLTLSKYLKEKCTMSVLDRCVFRYVRNGKLHGIILTHVDDLLYAGTPTFHREIIDGVRRDFKISRIHAGVFTYLGWNVRQDKGEIRVDQRGYGQSITQTELSTEKKKQLESKLTDEEKKIYQKQLGRMLWLSGQTRPDLSFDTLELSTYSSNACVKHVKVLNKVARKITGGPKSLCFKGLDLRRDNISITFYTDASVGNTFTENGRQTQSGRGYLVFLTNGKTANLIDWSSRKLKRVVHSAFGAETLACIDAMGAAIYVRQILSEILYGDTKSEIIPIHGFTDSRQLHDHVHTSKQCEEKRLRLDLAELQQALNNKTIKSLTWIPTKDMLADCLTKKDANCEKLCTVIERGEFLE